MRNHTGSFQYSFFLELENNSLEMSYNFHHGIFWAAVEINLRSCSPKRVFAIFQFPCCCLLLSMRVTLPVLIPRLWLAQGWLAQCCLLQQLVLLLQAHWTGIYFSWTHGCDATELNWMYLKAQPTMWITFCSWSSICDHSKGLFQLLSLHVHPVVFTSIF